MRRFGFGVAFRRFPVAFGSGLGLLGLLLCAALPAHIAPWVAPWVGALLFGALGFSSGRAAGRQTLVQPDASVEIAHPTSAPPTSAPPTSAPAGGATTRSIRPWLHEIRNPLQVMLGEAEILRQQGVSEPLVVDLEETVERMRAALSTLRKAEADREAPNHSLDEGEPTPRPVPPSPR